MLENGLQRLYINLNCLKFISDMNLSPVDQILLLFDLFHILY